jgi:hypothetical protein
MKQPKVETEVRAERFVLVDGKGRERARLFTVGGAVVKKPCWRSTTPTATCA